MTIQKRWLAFAAALISFFSSFLTNYINENPIVVGDALNVRTPVIR